VCSAFEIAALLLTVVLPTAVHISSRYLARTRNKRLSASKSRDLFFLSFQVRHPLERLLSSWRYLFRSQAWQQMLRDRPDIAAAHRRLLGLSWPGFVEEILLGRAGRFGLTPEQLQNGSQPWITVVEHFAPMWLWCSPCQAGLRPHIIVKLETIQRDGPAVMQLLNLTASSATVPFLNVHVTTPFERPEDVGVNSRDKVAEYYGQLRKRQVAELYHMFRLDHELFGYSPEPYIQLAMD
jgi:hypothetical protein